MNTSRGPGDDKKSFNLTSRNRQKTPTPGVTDGPGFTWQEHAYERLKVLYGAGKILSTEEIETSFPKILGLCSATFPVVTAVLIRKRTTTILSDVWRADSATPESIERAIANAKKSYIYLSGDMTPEAEGLHSNSPLTTDPRNYLALPLTVDSLPAFGVLQLEGSTLLNERDLEFMNALADLFGIAIDRLHKKLAEDKRRDEIAYESSKKLLTTKVQVMDLEIERELREKFVALLTHDLRTPLSAIRLNAQLLPQRAVKNPDAVPKIAARIVSSVDRADQMITNLLDANRIRSGEKIPLQLEPCELSTVVNSTINELTTIHGARFFVDIAAPINGYWDPKGLRRILENLCSNAVKYGNTETLIDVSVFELSGKVIIKVKNRGEPISTEDQKFLFRQFHRTRKADLGPKRGWGIGLTLVLGVAEAHGGTVKVASDSKRGTVFTIELPIDSRPFVGSEKDFEIGLRAKNPRTESLEKISGDPASKPNLP